MTIIARWRPGSRGKSRNPETFLVACPNVTIRISALPPDAPRKVTPSGLSFRPQCGIPAVPNARVLRAGALLLLADASQRTRWMRAHDADTDVTTCEVFISICSTNIQTRYY